MAKAQEEEMTYLAGRLIVAVGMQRDSKFLMVDMLYPGVFHQPDVPFLVEERSQRLSLMKGPLKRLM